MTSAISLNDLLKRNTMEAAPQLVDHLPDGVVRCLACGHRCRIPGGRPGVCRVRFNEAGTLRVPSGYVAGLAVDPIEKKPFFHAFPGGNALSFGMLGCDYHCAYCQNWVTSQAIRDDKATAMPEFCDPSKLVGLAIRHKTPVIVSTYNEPLITADWAMTIFRRARAEGITCGFVSNGNATPEVLEYIRPCVDLYKVDLKSFEDRNYRKLGGTLQTVLDTIRLLKKMDFWVEIVTLVVPGFNDTPDELTKIAEFVASVSSDIPWHITAFHPEYKMSDPPRTTVDSLLGAYDIGKRVGLKYVYPGNIPGAFGDRENTYCPNCGATLIRREGFRVLENKMIHDACPKCDHKISGRWGSGSVGFRVGGNPTQPNA